ncbi:DUF2306 domain-containing protein [Thalassotalea euphylliae]|uniref:DUF2306 domain-containing protein n=1 Tax=Thalassotalea euphylliae TaxID=1655234 RepID=A0A3E0TMA7_9GAMM|nr:DUF2306 domain-containing protein [Thalassotalea euphylliae]REL25487.1 DUF2306 domain-containing protein [Thalassotalea euphylliae]
MASTQNYAQNTLKFNWPIVGSLLFLTGLAGLPAIAIVTLSLMGPNAITGISSLLNQVYFETPAALYVHGGAGILYFLTMPWQFSPRIRHKYPVWHKVAGRIVLISGCVMAVSGIWLHQVLSPHEQGARFYSLIFTSGMICVAFAMAISQISQRKVQAHQRWMARAVALTLTAITPLFVDLLILLLFSHVDTIYDLIVKLHFDYGRLLAMVINLTIVEIALNKRFKH